MKRHLRKIERDYDDNEIYNISGSSHVSQRVHPRYRIIRILVTFIVTLSLCAGYVFADLANIIPGPLQWEALEQFQTPSSSFSIDSAFSTGDLHSLFEENGTSRTKNVAVEKNRDFSSQISTINDIVHDFVTAEDPEENISLSLADPWGKNVFQLNSHDVREPASVLKTLMAFAVSHTLNMGRTLDTQMYFQQLSSGVNTVYLKGNGDMLLSASTSDPKHINGRAGLLTLAKRTIEALRLRGVKNVSLRYDDTLFGSEREPAHVNENNSQNRYFTPLSSMAIDGGRQWPEGAKPSNPDNWLAYPPLSQHTADDVVSVMKKYLEDGGIKIDDIAPATVPSESAVIASVSSAPLNEILAFTLHHSDNTLAELLARFLALHMHFPNTTQGAANAIQAVLKKYHIPLDGLDMQDSSGLSPGSHITSQTLVQVQVHNLMSDGGTAAAYALPLVGFEGTVRRRLIDNNAGGLIRAKTGTLDTTTSMVGTILCKNGGALAFSVIINNVKNTSHSRHNIDILISKLANL